ncbi:hypothetical protein RB195_021822 [Necator americanus]|uniref:Uncharacterized protein n=1 Tax=Necator americanus TaxID=51031 RepID=A0ABR1ED35_NECAM
MTPTDICDSLWSLQRKEDEPPQRDHHEAEQPIQGIADDIMVMSVLCCRVLCVFSVLEEVKKPLPSSSTQQIFYQADSTTQCPRQFANSTPRFSEASFEFRKHITSTLETAPLVTSRACPQPSDTPTKVDDMIINDRQHVLSSSTMISYIRHIAGITCEQIMLVNSSCIDDIRNGLPEYFSTASEEELLEFTEGQKINHESLFTQLTKLEDLNKESINLMNGNQWII